MVQKPDTFNLSLISQHTRPPTYIEFVKVEERRQNNSNKLSADLKTFGNRYSYDSRTNNSWKRVHKTIYILCNTLLQISINSQKSNGCSLIRLKSNKCCSKTFTENISYLCQSLEYQEHVYFLNYYQVASTSWSL